MISQINQTRWIVADPRLALDYGLTDDHPYGTVETLTNAKVGDSLDFYQLSTMMPQGSAVISGITRITDPKLIQQLNVTLNALGQKATPPTHPQQPGLLRGLYQPAEQQCHSRRSCCSAGLGCQRRSSAQLLLSRRSRWVGGECCSLMPTKKSTYKRCSSLSLVPPYLFLLSPSFLPPFLLRFRWKSSNSMIVNNVWTQASGCTTLEVTMLMEWLEGPALIENVLIANNQIHGPEAQQKGPGFIRVCQGICGQQSVPPGFANACGNIQTVNNTIGA